MTEAVKNWEERQGTGVIAAMRAMNDEITELRARVAELERQHPPRVTPEMWQAGMDMLKEAKEMQGRISELGQDAEPVAQKPGYITTVPDHHDRIVWRNAYYHLPLEARQPMSDEPVAWKHDCSALCTNDVEFWIDRCPHCGKPRTAPAQPPRQPMSDEQIFEAVNDADLDWQKGFCYDGTSEVQRNRYVDLARAIEAHITGGKE